VTLIEISIVLAIIGLIAGSIIIGRTLIHDAEVLSIITDEERYKKATQLFKDKYLYFPGDMPNATEFWGTDSNCADQNQGANIIAKTATCNGNGDGFIGPNNGPDSSLVTMFGMIGNSPVADFEPYRFWQHLSNAGFIRGAYTGALSSRTSGPDPGMNVPVGPLPNSGYMISYAQPTSHDSGNGIYAGNYRHIITFGASTNNWQWTMVEPVLPPSDALSIDKKIDDGMPGLGNVMTLSPEGVNNFAPHCATPANEQTAQYDTSYTDSQCMLIFITGL
jgi:hypothetical protein